MSEDGVRARDARRVEFGDWQTPEVLAEQVLRVVCNGMEPATVLEPTCGEGAFLAAASRVFPRAHLVGFDISSNYVAKARERLPMDRTSVSVADFFSVLWERIVAGLDEPLLLVGNPPWVTSAALGMLDATNLPTKTNFKRHTGLDAMTGKSNFDISEWMLIRLLEALGERSFTLAMLCKATVARRLMEHVAQRGWRIRGAVHSIDAQLHFDAAVDAVVLCLRRSEANDLERGEARWPVYETLGASKPSRTMGVIAGRVCSDVAAFARTEELAGTAEIEWRSGLKHDCAKVMELDYAAGELRNGFGELTEVEPEYVFPLLKGSDIANGRLVPRRCVLVPQRRLGEDTANLREGAPMLWHYLDTHRVHLDGRKSSIYRDQPSFAIFGVGDYSFAPFKVAICGLYKKLAFSVVRPVGGRPVMLDDTVYFLPCSTEEEAEVLAAALSSERARAFFDARIFWDAKRPVGKSVLQSMSLDKLLQMEGQSLRLRPHRVEQQRLAF